MESLRCWWVLKDTKISKWWSDAKSYPLIQILIFNVVDLIYCVFFSSFSQFYFRIDFFLNFIFIPFVKNCIIVPLMFSGFSFYSHKCNVSTSLRCFKCQVTFFSQTTEERQQALHTFAAQSFLGSSSGSGSSAHAFPSPTGSAEPKPKVKRGLRKNQKEKYRLKYLRLRKTARDMIFVSLFLFKIKISLKLFLLAIHTWCDENL